MMQNVEEFAMCVRNVTSILNDNGSELSLMNYMQAIGEGTIEAADEATGITWESDPLEKRYLDAEARMIGELYKESNTTKGFFSWFFDMWMYVWAKGLLN